MSGRMNWEKKRGRKVSVVDEEDFLKRDHASVYLDRILGVPNCKQPMPFRRKRKKKRETPAEAAARAERVRRYLAEKRR
jgi:hypothetical protein